MADKDLYSILGIQKGATADEIKSAYRAKAKEFHPDKFANKSESERKAAEEKFKEVQHAYDVLNDPQKKEIYDQYGTEEAPNPFGGGGSGFNPFGGSGDPFSDIFSMFSEGFGGRRQRQQDLSGDDLKVGLKLSFKDVCFGVQNKEITYNRKERCPVCGGTGAKSVAGVAKCSKCNGSGQYTRVQNTLFGAMRQTGPCPDCNGTGEVIKDPCQNCKGRKLVTVKHTAKVSIPAGLNNDQTITLRGEGSASASKNYPNGNLYVVISTEQSNLYIRDEFDLLYIYPITIFQAALGDKVKVPTIYGLEEITIPAGTQSGYVITLKGKGLNNFRTKKNGDLKIQINVEVPSSLSFAQKNVLKDAQEKMKDVKYDAIDKFNKKASKE
ncbi:MAG: DnaJ domain-containing protein [Clostridia bacterium]|nr:DnaJ domain-containing protein [Clostridia bacterium]